MYQLQLKPNMLEVLPYPDPEIALRGYRGTLYEYPDYAVPTHWHKDWEFIIIEEGQGSYFVNSKVYPLRPGDGLFINSNRLHSGVSTDGRDFTYSVLQIHASVFADNPLIVRQYSDPLSSPESLDSLFLSPNVPWQKSLLTRISELIDLNLVRPEYYELESMSGIYSIFRMLYPHIIPTRSLQNDSSADTTHLMDIITFIQENFSAKITLKDIASAGAMCQSKCSKLFRDTLQETPMSYLKNLRIQKSIAMLSDTQMSITDVACACGFCSTSYYTEVFKQTTNITPSEFRRNNRPFVEEEEEKAV